MTRLISLLAVLLILCGCVQRPSPAEMDQNEITQLESWVDFARAQLQKKQDIIDQQFELIELQRKLIADYKAQVEALRKIHAQPKEAAIPSGQTWFAPSGPGWHEGPPMIMQGGEQEP